MCRALPERSENSFLFTSSFREGRFPNIHRSGGSGCEEEEEEQEEEGEGGFAASVATVVKDERELKGMFVEALSCMDAGLKWLNGGNEEN
ncbi:hypothetical protein C0Q70_13393 [Pomacea canaliculata]|uniref:Uncharacterized protein n=1 Tax=Pomacea canaliculata TaxID=400727 RepID=A0A2T7NX36_POMCA|nr:hypothetical protein C0Q70_13393 [Pomacea canaliculata]